MFTTNSVYVQIFDENSLALILQNITVVVTGTTENTYYTLNGTLYLDNLADETYTFKLSGQNYTQKTYTVTVSNRSTQTLNTYLSSAVTTTILQIYNENDGSQIENVFVNVEKIINGSYTTIESKFTDITGRVQVVYTPLVAYRFTLSKTNFVTKQFTLNPVLFSSYSVGLTPSISSNNTLDYNLLSLIWYPKQFLNNQVNNLTFIISSPYGYLTYYNFIAKFKNNTVTSSGVNSYGATLNVLLNISNASTKDRVYINYSYSTTTNGLKTFAFNYEVTGASNVGNHTTQNLKTADYGLGMIEKALMVLFVTVILAGFSFYVAGIGGALAMGLLVQGVGVYLNFLPISSFLISALVGLALIVGSGLGGNK